MVVNPYYVTMLLCYFGVGGQRQHHVGCVCVAVSPASSTTPRLPQKNQPNFFPKNLSPCPPAVPSSPPQANNAPPRRKPTGCAGATKSGDRNQITSSPHRRRDPTERNFYSDSGSSSDETFGGAPARHCKGTHHGRPCPREVFRDGYCEKHHRRYAPQPDPVAEVASAPHDPFHPLQFQREQQRHRVCKDVFCGNRAVHEGFCLEHAPVGASFSDDDGSIGRLSMDDLRSAVEEIEQPAPAPASASAAAAAAAAPPITDDAILHAIYHDNFAVLNRADKPKVIEVAKKLIHRGTTTLGTLSKFFISRAQNQLAFDSAVHQQSQFEKMLLQQQSSALKEQATKAKYAKTYRIKNPHASPQEIALKYSQWCEQQEKQKVLEEQKKLAEYRELLNKLTEHIFRRSTQKQAKIIKSQQEGYERTIAKLGKAVAQLQKHVALNRKLQSLNNKLHAKLHEQQQVMELMVQQVKLAQQKEEAVRAKHKQEKQMVEAAKQQVAQLKQKLRRAGKGTEL